MDDLHAVDPGLRAALPGILATGTRR